MSTGAKRSDLERWDFPRDVWAIFTGSEGDDPRLVALVYDEGLAMALCEARDADGRIMCDPDFSPARRTRTGIVWANHFEIRTHAQLAALLGDGRLGVSTG